MDIEVCSLTSTQEFVDALNAQMADGIKVLEVKLLPDNAGNAMASVAAARYTVAFRKEYYPFFLNSSVVDNFMSQEQIIVTKKTKKSESTFDMKPYIFECLFQKENCSITMTVDASSANNLKPSLVVRALYEANKQEFDDFGLFITREETYTNVGTADAVQLKPLGAVGVNIDE